MNGSSCQGRGRWVWSAFSRAAVVWTVWLVSLGVSSVSAAPPAGRPWVRHTVDDTSRGADGVRLGDINGDGLPDVVTGWEEGGVIRVYVNPGPARAAQPWPRVTVGRVGSPEDAVFVDLDRDGLLDVVSSCEGSVQTVFVHWSPRSRARLLDDSAWTTQPIPATENRRRWMFCLPLEIDGRNGVDLVVGSKQRNAAVGWLQSPTDPRDLARWQWHPLFSAGWVMSLLAVDVDHDGDLDVMTANQGNDPQDPYRPMYLFRNHNGTLETTPSWASAEWSIQNFLAAADYDGDGWEEIAVSKWVNFQSGIYDNLSGTPSAAPVWTTGDAGTDKGVAWGDFDANGWPDLVVGHDQPTRMYANDAGTLTLAWESSAPFFSPNDYRVFDVDGDGDLDLAETHFADGRTHIYLNRNGVLDSVPTWTYDSSAVGTAVAYGDINGDGAPDLVIGYSGNPSVVVFYNQQPPCPADLNGDGVVDVIDLSVLLDSFGGSGSPSSGDLDGDGDVDLIDLSLLLSDFGTACN